MLDWLLQHAERRKTIIEIAKRSDAWLSAMLSGTEVPQGAAPGDRSGPRQRSLSLAERPRKSTWPVSACLALRMSYVGELGWELHVPVDRRAWLAGLRRALARRPEAHGIENFGSLTLNALRWKRASRAPAN